MNTLESVMSILAEVNKLGETPRLKRIKRMLVHEMLVCLPIDGPSHRGKYKYPLTKDEEGWVEHYIANNGQGYVCVDGISVWPKIQAIKSVRIRNIGFDLKQAKDYVEAAIEERRSRK